MKMNNKIACRNISIDISRAYGMVLVFYGHLWFSDTFPSHQVMLQNKLIYSFHMPLFFLLSGIVFKYRQQKIGEFIKKKFVTRILPAIFYSWCLLAGKIAINLTQNNVFSWKEYIKLSMAFIWGHPFHPLAWFLVCLFSTEILYFILFAQTKDYGKTFVICFICFCIGTVMVEIKYFFPFFLDIVDLNHWNIFSNFWYVRESLISILFFNIGHIIGKNNTLGFIEKFHIKYKISLLIIFFVLTLSTFNLNNRLSSDFIVLMVIGKHGNPLLFLVTAIAGAFSVILLSALTPINSFLYYCGRNSIVLLGINGFFRDMINPYFVKKIPQQLFDTYIYSIILCLIITLLSISMCRYCLLSFLNKIYYRFWEKPISNIILKGVP